MYEQLSVFIGSLFSIIQRTCVDFIILCVRYVHILCGVRSKTAWMRAVLHAGRAHAQLSSVSAAMAASRKDVDPARRQPLPAAICALVEAVGPAARPPPASVCPARGSGAGT